MSNVLLFIVSLLFKGFSPLHNAHYTSHPKELVKQKKEEEKKHFEWQRHLFGSEQKEVHCQPCSSKSFSWQDIQGKSGKISVQRPGLPASKGGPPFISFDF